MNREACGARGEQTAKPLPAESIGIAFGRAGEVGRRQLCQILAIGERAEHEFDRRPPIAEIVRQRLLAADVGLARGLVDRTRGAHLGGEKIFQLALSRIAQADAHFLTSRRRIDFDSLARRKPGYRIGIRRMDPVRAAVKGYAEAGRVGDAAAADMIGRFDQGVTAAGGREPARGGDPGRTGPDDNDVDIARSRSRQWRAQRRTRRKRSGSGKKRAAA